MYTIEAFILMDTEGKRIIAKYYNHVMPTLKEQAAFEKNLFDKVRRQPGGEILMLDGHIVTYKNSVDTFMVIVGSLEENELLLANVLQVFHEALTILLKGPPEKRAMMEHMDVVVLALDETIDEGVILEAEPNVIASRITRRVADNDLPLSEQSLTQALQSARDQLAKSLLS
ncbi:snare-like protein [Caulochytrium protostelioides]|nr:snare-like protein [Caulochytrium protostelioides]